MTSDPQGRLPALGCNHGVGGQDSRHHILPPFGRRTFELLCVNRLEFLDFIQEPNQDLGHQIYSTVCGVAVVVSREGYHTPGAPLHSVVTPRGR